MIYELIQIISRSNIINLSETIIQQTKINKIYLI